MVIEGKERTFVPYKGWRVENMGQLVPDPLMHIANEPPLKIVDDIDRFVNSNEISHKHILYNVLDKCGKEILSKWVRNISYVTSLDIYLIEDNNEDELLEKNNYKFFNSNEYCERHNVITNAGELLSKDWFDDIIVSTYGYLKVKRNGKQNLIDLNGRLLLNSDADFVSNYNGEFAYCCRNGILYQVFPGGIEKEFKHLEVCNKELFEIHHKEYTRMFKWMDKISERTEFDYKWNMLFLDKYQLFDQNYDQIRESLIAGLLFVTNDGETKLKDISDKTLTNFSFKVPDDSFFINGLAAIGVEGQYGLIDPLGNIVCEGFSSALWAPQGIEGAPWEMYYCRNGEEMHYYHGQGGEFIAWVHDFLLSNQIAYLLEKNNIWYYPDNSNDIVGLFEYYLDNDNL